MAEHAERDAGVTPAGTTVSRDIPVGTAVTTADFGFCALGMWVFLHLGSVSLGGPAKPSLGPALIK